MKSIHSIQAVLVLFLLALSMVTLSACPPSGWCEEHGQGHCYTPPIK